ncbi:MAG: hypothetical protein ASARMPREDX12_001319 [Alectoria sarmentosa]|nr:MAG: hypothetical protein ASARMPREDX12_001319 [Alectoria sarmentosa]
MFSYFTLTLLHLLTLPTFALAGDAQFYDSSSKIGFAVSTAQNASSTNLFFQLSAPQAAGWGAVGSGTRMDGSLMFVIYASGEDDGVTVSVRTTHGHNTPEAIDDIDLAVLSSTIQNSTMTANVICYNCTAWSSGSSIDTTSKTQPWIWAVGPGQPLVSASRSVTFNQHASYGNFFVDMTAAQSDSATTAPNISGTSSTNTKALSSSFSALVVVHAIALAGSFLLLFPFGVILLRWFGSFKFHWMLQVAASAICLIGFFCAIALSVIDPQFKSFNQAHQILGIIAVAMLLPQVYLGYSHHRNYKKLGQRTAISHLHFWAGRLVVVLGMVNAVL